MTDVETPHELVLVNRYDAKPEQVWAAWTRPENFVQWWCPPDWTVSDVVMEVQPRGRFQQTQSSPDGTMVMPFAGFYREVVAPGRLVSPSATRRRPTTKPVPYSRCGCARRTAAPSRSSARLAWSPMSTSRP
jgi:uncharacterized protein YndB with AHSA1/START domain